MTIIFQLSFEFKNIKLLKRVVKKNVKDHELVECKVDYNDHSDTYLACKYDTSTDVGY
jgi:hypothetical protein